MDNTSNIKVTSTIDRKGFIIPEGYSWNANMNNGKKKEGRITVKDQYGCLSHVLQFTNDKLNGICEFYVLGSLVEKRTFVNDIEEGWGCEVDHKKEVRWYFYSNGIRKTILNKYDKMDNYWEAIDLSNNQLISICQYDENHKAHGKGYIFEDNEIKKIVLFENGEEKNLLKSFKGNEMIEYGNDGEIVYKGGYVNDICKDYVREGEGKEFDNGVLIYGGKWMNDNREGEGKSLKDGICEYEGCWKEGLPNGFGVLERNDELYEGDWIMGKLKLKSNEDEWYDYKSGKIEKRVNKMISNKNELLGLLNDEDIKRNVKELVICEGCCNDMRNDLILSGFVNLERIVFKRYSLQNLNSLKIIDNIALKIIDIEDERGGNTSYGSCINVKSVILESMMNDD